MVGRPKGSKDKKPRSYTLSGSALAQRHSACLTRRRKRMTDKGVLEVKDRGKLSELDRLTGGDAELERFYKQVLVDGATNPSRWLIKKLAEAEVRLRKYEDSEPDAKALSPEFLATVKVSNELVKTHLKAVEQREKSRWAKRRVISDQDLTGSDVVEVDFDDL